MCRRRKSRARAITEQVVVQMKRFKARWTRRDESYTTVCLLSRSRVLWGTVKTTNREQLCKPDVVPEVYGTGMRATNG